MRHLPDPYLCGMFMRWGFSLILSIANLACLADHLTHGVDLSQTPASMLGLQTCGPVFKCRWCELRCPCFCSMRSTHLAAARVACFLLQQIGFYLCFLLVMAWISASDETVNHPWSYVWERTLEDFQGGVTNQVGLIPVTRRIAGGHVRSQTMGNTALKQS